MTAKEYLKQTLKLNEEINTLRDVIEELEAKATKVTTVLDPNKVSQSTIVNREDIMVKICDTQNLVNDKLNKLVSLQNEIFRKIYNMENQIFRTLLISRYVNLKSFEQIAVEMCYTYRHITRLHGYALQEFEKRVL